MKDDIKCIICCNNVQQQYKHISKLICDSCLNDIHLLHEVNMTLEQT